MNTLPEKPLSVYAGLDVAKATLQLHLQGRQHALPNTAKGHAHLVKLLRTVPDVHVVCEATGGYERAAVAACHAAEVTVSASTRRACGTSPKPRVAAPRTIPSMPPFSPPSV